MTVQARTRSAQKSIAWLLLVTGAASFWVGGRVIHAFTGTGRVIAEAAGIGIALLLLSLGAVLRSNGKNREQ